VSAATEYKPTAEHVRRLREETGVGIIDCRNALVRASGDYEAAKRDLHEQGSAKAAKKQERAANEGLVGSYIHAGGKIGVLLELNCETDFVARNERFKELLRDISMHIAAMSPQYLDRAAVPIAAVEEATREFRASAPAGKPENVIEKIVEGKLIKWYEERVLLEQPFVKDDAQTIAELIASAVGVLGENIQVRRYAKFTLGEQ
jgi:elongation factor Ts